MSEQSAYSYYPGTNRLQAVTGTYPELFRYDADGNTTERIAGAANAQPAVQPAQYIYTHNGQRVKKASGGQVIYHYDLSCQLRSYLSANFRDVQNPIKIRLRGREFLRAVLNEYPLMMYAPF